MFCIVASCVFVNSSVMGARHFFQFARHCDVCPLCHSTTAPLFQLNLSRHHIKATMPANFKGKNSRSKIAPLSSFCKKNPSITVFTKCSCLLSHILRLLSLVSCLLYMSHNCPDPGMRIPPIQFTMMTHHGLFLSLTQILP